MIVLGIDGLDAVESIGEGGSAVVYRARDAAHDRDVAVKMLKGLANDDARRRFDRERKLMGRLSSHDGIVTIYSSGFNDRDVPYLVMPYLAGGSLDEYARRVGPEPHETAELLAQVARAVAAAHQQKVIHRDLKPANILMSDSQRPLVTDFGIARLNATLASQLSQLAYTPAFSPPEVMQGAEPSPAADVYSLGATLFAILSGHPPFDAALSSSPYPVINRVINEAVEDLSDSVPSDVCHIYRAAMAKDPTRRPTIDELIVLLDASAGHDRSPSVGQIATLTAAAGPLATGLDQPVSPVTNLISEHGLRDGEAPPPAMSPSRLGQVSSHKNRRRWPWLAGAVGMIAVAAMSYIGLGVLGGTNESASDTSTDAPTTSTPPSPEETGVGSPTQVQGTTPTTSKPTTAGNLTPGIEASTTPLAATIESTTTISTPAASTTTPNSALSASATIQPTTSPTATSPPTTAALPAQPSTTTSTTTAPTTSTVVTMSMPNVVGLTHGSAVETLSEAGIVVAACGNSCSALVTRQSPPGGTQVSSGATVTLTVTPNESQPIPNVVGLTGSQAVSVLTVQKPFLAGCGSDCSEPVTSMSPAAGTSALPLTVISLGFG